MLGEFDSGGMNWGDICTTAVTGHTTAITVADIIAARDKMLAIPKPDKSVDVIVMTDATLLQLAAHVAGHPTFFHREFLSMYGIPIRTAATPELASELAFDIMVNQKRSVMLVSE